MEKGTHGKDEKKFDDLSFIDQSRSINGQFRNLEKAIIAHLRKAKYLGKDEEEILNKRKIQLNRIITRLKK